MTQSPDYYYLDGQRLTAFDNNNDGTKTPSVITSNISTKFREAFEAYSPVAPGDPTTTTTTWVQSKAPGDIIVLDGNAIASSYLTVSLDPLSAGTESYIETLARFSMPIELAAGLSLSQRTLGQEFSVEVVDTVELPNIPQISVTSLTHGNATLTLTTATNHGLTPGKSIGLRGFADSRFNYPSLVVAAIPAPNQITCTAGPGGTIPNITATVSGGFVYFRERLGRATNGTAMIFENATATNASFYLRSESGDALPSGTVIGNHSATILTTASVQAINSAYTYAFQPTDEYRLTLQADRVQWSNATVDTSALATNVTSRTQVIPDPSVLYKLRIRATNNAGLSTPVAQIVSAVKTGTTTATITCDRDHGLTTSDLVVVYGIRDQAAASFPNLLVATAVASTPTSNSFTIVIGTAATVTSYGGLVARVNGGNLPSALGYNAVVAQSAVLTTLGDGTRQLVVTGNTNWAGLLIGDYINLVGVRNAVDGATLGVDGSWKVANVATTALTLVPVGATVAPADFVSVNCGGAVIKRTDLRISYLRLFDYERERVEVLNRPTGDTAGSVPVVINGTPTVSFTQPALVAGTALIGDVAVQYRATASGASATHIVSAATTNSTLVKNAAGKVLGWHFANTTGAWVYVKLHNQATAPTAGTGVVRTIGIPPNGVSSWFSEGGITFATGIGLTTVTGAADADATAVGLNAIVGEIVFA